MDATNKGGRADPLVQDLKKQGWRETPWKSDLFDWLLKTGRHVLMYDGELVVPGWVATAMQAYGNDYAQMSIIEFLERLSGTHPDYVENS
jgi:hypothetical protein